MTPVKPQNLKKFQAEESWLLGFNYVIQHLISQAFAKRIKSFAHVSVSYVSNSLIVGRSRH
jgi:hypothetical protein